MLSNQLRWEAPKRRLNVQKNLHFDNEQDIHTSFKIEKENDYNHNLESAIISQYIDRLN